MIIKMITPTIMMRTVHVKANIKHSQKTHKGSVSGCGNNGGWQNSVDH